MRKKGIVMKINFVAVWRFIKRHLLRIESDRPKFFGFIKDGPDERDIIYKIKRITRELPASTEMANIERFPYRYNQGDIGSCVGHGVTAAFRRVLQINLMTDFEPSRLFAYYIARKDKLNDTGATIRDAFKAMNRNGLCSERAWPYVECKFNSQPPEDAFKEALDHQTIRYERIWPVTKDSIRDIVSSGYPIVYGKMIYESFMGQKASRTGEIPIPDPQKEQFYGGHCMIIFDYDENGTIELNSWGKSWGQKGLCRVPWEYVLNPDLCQDFWVLYLTE